MKTPQISKAAVEAGAEAAHNFIRTHGTYPDLSAPTWSKVSRWIGSNRRALARAVLRAAARVEGGK